MNTWLGEIVRGWRTALRRPGFLLLAGGVLALGIGASATAFALLDRLLLQPLPLPQASRLVAAGPVGGRGIPLVSARQYRHLDSLGGVRAHGLLTWVTPGTNIAVDGVPARASVAYADRHLLPTLGLEPALGRNFEADEDRPRGPAAVLLSHGFWARRFGADPGAIGRSIEVEGVAHTIVGVLPAAFDDTSGGGDIVLPAALSADGRGDRRRYLAVLRLAKDADRSAVGAEVDSRLRALDAASGRSEAHPRRFGVRGYRSVLHVFVEPIATMFQAAALVVLVIALVNLAGLMLLRALTRHHELAVRDALGASGVRLALPLLAEGALVGLLGAGLGLLLTWLALAILAHLIPVQVTGGRLPLGGTAIAAAVSMAIAAATVSTALGLRRVRGMIGSDELAAGGRSGMGAHRGRLGRALVVAQVTLSAVLLCASGMFLRTSLDNARVPPGFASRGILTAAVAPVRASYPDADAVKGFSQRLLRRLRAIPGVDAATAATNLPIGDYFGMFPARVEANDGTAQIVSYHGVAPGFLRLYSMRLRRGRRFTRDDVRGSEPVAIISRSLAGRLFGGTALGRRIGIGHAGSSTSLLRARIVGVVDDVGLPHRGGRRSLDLYVPLDQVPGPMMARFRDTESMRFAVRVRSAPDTYAEAVRKAVSAVDPEQPVARLRSMQSIADEQGVGAKTGMWLTGVFAGLALLLAASGLYAVTAVSVSAREHELGVRAAVGASPRSLFAHVLAGALKPVAAGLLVGLALLALLPTAMHAALVQLGGRLALGPLVAGGVCALLLAAGALSALRPAWRASRVRPRRALVGD